MFQTIREIARPALRCERVGHVPVGQTRRGFAYPSLGIFGGVADSVTLERQVCRRCKAEVSPWEETRRRTLNGLTMDSERWDRLREEGFIEE